MEQRSSHRLAYVYVLLGAALWGIIGLFVDGLYSAGFNAFQIVTLRVVSAATMLVIWLAINNPDLLVIDWRDSISFIGTGIFSIVFFNWAYFTAIEEVSLSVAVILLYTGPAFVAILARIVFGEPLTARKLAALLLTLVGCALAIRLIPFTDEHISWYGLIVGLGAGFGYALYSIFGKQALKKYHSKTVITYTFVFASFFMVPFNSWTFEVTQFESVSVWLLIVGLGIFPTALAYLLYTSGLSMLESSKASITTTIEPVIATLVGVFFFQEALTGYQVLGMALVLAAVIIIQVRKKKKSVR